MLPAGNASLGADRTANLRFLRCFDFFFPAWSAAVMFFSTLGDAFTGTLGTCCVGALIDCVICWLGSGDSCQDPFAADAGHTSPCVCSAGRLNILLVTSAFVAINLSVRRCNCSISSTPFSLSIALIVFAHSAIAAIILSACVIVGLVMFLWLNCTVSVSRSLRVSLTWHK